MTYEDRQQENRQEYNRWLDQQQYRRQDEQWNKKRLEGERAEASRYFRQGDLYLGIYRLAGPAAAEAYAQRMREHQAYGAADAAPSSLTTAPNAMAHWNRAWTDVGAGNYTSALANLNVAIVVEPGNANWYAHRAYIYYLLQQYEAAETDATRALSYDAGLPDGYFRRALARVARGRNQDALSDLNLVIALAPRDYPAAFYNRGDIYLSQQNYLAAEGDFSDCIALDPKDGSAHHNRGICRVNLKDFDGAISDLSQALSLFDDELEDARDGKSILAIDSAAQWAYYWRGNAYYSKGYPEQAIDDLDHFIQTPSGDFRAGVVAYAYTMRAHAKQWLKLHEDAIEDLTEALELNPTANCFRDRAQSYRALGDYAGALRDLDQVIRLDPTPDDYTWRGWVYLNLGGLDDDALLDFESAMGLGDQRAFVYLGRARAQRNMGNVANALEDYNTVIQLDPDHWSAYRNRGCLRFDLDEYETALADFSEDIRINPTEPRSYMARGDCQLKLGHWKAATQDFLKAAELFREQNLPEKAEEAAARAFKEW